MLCVFVKGSRRFSIPSRRFLRSAAALIVKESCAIGSSEPANRPDQDIRVAGTKGWKVAQDTYPRRVRTRQSAEIEARKPLKTRIVRLP